ncbi:MAG: hypothetical protein QY330_02150 [Candidatus Dojkabacteria bacterium]|uniref:Uncharacterized protein n=2 Tax=Candidatus Dojkabacteria TaxID=74243 RepID=A0A136KK09_9BACT|nr:MAG: hypothetical protein UZ20_WS6002000427 [candidate division WS6 bacterium OLB21]MBW7953244.1 hypothetical protein [Candidatus Dojkabacteria bacterium]WKZ28389.1 MAG: hypothetical protein QY330_02150 [Candidatus Dojkabacteria bacterium]
MYGAEYQRTIVSSLGKNQSANTVDLILRLTLAVILFVAGWLSHSFLLSNGYLGQAEDQTTQGEVAGESIKNNDVAQNVAKKLLIPDDEKPTVATISDIEQLKLSNPNFYFYAQNGDRLLVYSDKAVIYRESQDIIIAIVPIKRSDLEVATPTPTLEE